MSRGHDIDLDWEKESDQDLMFQVEREEEIKAEYYEWLKTQRKPALIKIITPIKNEISSNTFPLRGINKKKL